MEEKEYYEFMSAMGNILNKTVQKAKELGIEPEAMSELAQRLKDGGRLGLFFIDCKKSGAELVWNDMYDETKIWEKPGGKNGPLVLYVESCGDYIRCDFGKSWDEICRDPQIPGLIADTYLFDGNEEVEEIREWAVKGQDPFAAPFGVYRLFLSEYPREEYKF